MYVCLCRGLKESDVRSALREGHITHEALIARLGWDDPKCCGRCARGADRFLLLTVEQALKPVASPVA